MNSESDVFGWRQQAFSLFSHEKAVLSKRKGEIGLVEQRHKKTGRLI